MKIKDMPYATREQALVLRYAAIKLENERDELLMLRDSAMREISMLRESAMKLAEYSHKLKTRLRAMQECAIGSQDWNWLEAKDGASDPSGLHISFMQDLWATAHADHSDVLGEE